MWLKTETQNFENIHKCFSLVLLVRNLTIREVVTCQWLPSLLVVLEPESWAVVIPFGLGCRFDPFLSVKPGAGLYKSDFCHCDNLSEKN